MSRLEAGSRIEARKERHRERRVGAAQLCGLLSQNGFISESKHPSLCDSEALCEINSKDLSQAAKQICVKQPSVFMSNSQVNLRQIAKQNCVKQPHIF